VDDLRRAVNVVLPLAIAAVLAIAALPSGRLGPLADAERCGDGKVSCKDWIVQQLRSISVSASWGMYAPAPQRSQAYMLLTAIDADGSERALEENDVAAAGWGTAWMWTKDRNDILRHAVGYFRASKPNRNRVWFLRSVCVREDRAGHAPVQIRMEQVRRRFNAPEKVRAGAPVLGAPSVRSIQVMGCRAKIVQDMIEEDRARRAHG